MSRRSFTIPRPACSSLAWALIRLRPSPALGVSAPLVAATIKRAEKRPRSPLDKPPRPLEPLGPPKRFWRGYVPFLSGWAPENRPHYLAEASGRPKCDINVAFGPLSRSSAAAWAASARHV